MRTLIEAPSGLFINSNGRVVCVKHGGGYLESALSRRPNAMVIDTPLDNWERLLLGEVREFGVSCEECS
jgi:hypothetical protein